MSNEKPAPIYRVVEKTSGHTRYLIGMVDTEGTRLPLSSETVLAFAGNDAEKLRIEPMEEKDATAGATQRVQSQHRPHTTSK
jgi:hypothetical protein